MNIILWCPHVALIGYIGYNYFCRTKGKPPFYWHKYEIPYFFLSGAAFALYSEYGFAWQNIGFNIALLKAFITGVCMVLLHLSFVNDWLYYCWCWLFNVKDWEGRKTANNYFFVHKNIAHAHWTFAGMFGVTDRKVILWQAWVSVFIVILVKIATCYIPQ